MATVYDGTPDNWVDRFKSGTLHLVMGTPERFSPRSRMDLGGNL